MSVTTASSLLFLPWALIGTAVWWKDLRSPMLFLVVALLAGLGAKTVSSALLIMWQATNNQFFAVPAAQVRAAQLHELAFHAITTFCILAPIYWLLSKRL